MAMRGSFLWISFLGPLSTQRVIQSSRVIFMGEDEAPGRYSDSCQGHRFSKWRSQDLNTGFLITSPVLCSTILWHCNKWTQQVLKELWVKVFSQFRCHRDLR